MCPARVLSLVALFLALPAPASAQAPAMQMGEEVEILDVVLPDLAVADKPFPLEVTVRNKMESEVTVNLAPLFYHPTPEKDYPCGNQADDHYRGPTSQLVASLTIPGGESRTFPTDARAPPWMQTVKREWVANGAHDYELCVAAVEPGYKDVAPVYRDLESARLRVRSDNVPPQADFTWSPLKGNATHPVSFTATATDLEEDPLTYRWDFGYYAASGRARAEGAAAKHAFYPAGEYEVTLAVSDGYDATTVRKTVEILPETVPAVEGGGAASRLLPGPGLLAVLLALGAAVGLARPR